MGAVSFNIWIEVDPGGALGLGVYQQAWLPGEKKALCGDRSGRLGYGSPSRKNH
ncbi:MAG: hypothetical protein RBU30_14030 [Polyangia bacterium]|nr:hypothetical protein [Polyangia bacterium]